jgi:murein DD-endopeptidase MepM/ murein hydrolase activator NlpD
MTSIISTGEIVDLILVWGRKNRTLNLIVNWGIIALITVGIVAILVSFVYGIVNFTAKKVDDIKLKQLNQENKTVRDEITRLEKEVEDLGTMMDSLQQYDQRLRNYASLEPISKVVRNMGIGGPDNMQAGISQPTSRDLNELSKELDQLLARARLQNQSFKELMGYFEERKYIRDHTPSITPVHGWFVSGFGYRLDPFTGSVKMHEGIDIAAPIGTPIVAPANGMVMFVEDRRDFGITLEIDHGYGIVTRYCHCQRANVKEGVTVMRGDIIAFVGNTGRTTGPHLHYEVRVSQVPVNPINYIFTSDFAAK